MMERRDVVSGGLLGFTALFGGGAADAAQRGDNADVARAIDDLRQTLDRKLPPPFAELAQVRQQQRTFLKASGKFPDFIEVGIDVWERVYDWHVRYQVPPTIVVRDDGRYTMTYMFTTLILRPELMDNYIGFGYDAR
ncbi:MAG: hypothetical protein HY657_07395 [Acidobacteria bacterium]|nr:hypothetical protein [Acidobacteriota bacterium]